MNEESQQQEKLFVDPLILEAHVFHQLKSVDPGDHISAYNLEKIVCSVLGFKNTGKSNDYADGVKGELQISVKTRKIKPKINKRKESHDFQSHPEKHLGPQRENKKLNRWTDGVEVVQRRQRLDLINDKTELPEIVGHLTLEGFYNKVKASNVKYGTSETFEVIVVHGYDQTMNQYLLRIYWKRYEHQKSYMLNWVREGSSVCGYTKDEFPRKVCERIDGNVSRGGTCFKEYKDLTKYEKFVHVSVPLPDPHPFDLETIMAEIAEKRNPTQNTQLGLDI